MTLEEKIQAAIRNIPDFPRKGILFKDITPILLNTTLVREITEGLCQPYIDSEVQTIAAIESRGFLWGMLMAQRLQLPFIMIRKQGKLPASTQSIEYDLEYGRATIEIHEGFVEKNMRVVIHDDLLATGGTAHAAASLIKRVGGHVSAFSFVISLSFLKGEQLLASHQAPIHSILRY